jgi:hypothetical protein
MWRTGRSKKSGMSCHAFHPCPYSLVWHILYIRITALEQLQELNPAPPVGMHDVPKESVGEHLGLGKVQEDGRDELDERVARMSSFSLSICGIWPPIIEHARYLYNLQESDTPSLTRIFCTGLHLSTRDRETKCPQISKLGSALGMLRRYIQWMGGNLTRINADVRF